MRRRARRRQKRGKSPNGEEAADSVGFTEKKGGEAAACVEEKGRRPKTWKRRSLEYVLI